MEVVGLSASVIALAGLFNNAVDCFEFVQLGKNCGRDFLTTQLKLDNGRLRQSRWGESVGLSGDLKTKNAELLNQAFDSREAGRKAKDRLDHILDLIEEAKRTSEKYKGRVQLDDTDDTSLTVYSPQTHLDRVAASLHQTMRKLSIKRQNTIPLTQKVKWALYEEKTFTRLIDDITEAVDGLERLFQAAQATAQQLCEVEVSEISKSEELLLPKQVADSMDKALAKAIEGVIGKASGSSYHIDFHGSTNYGQQVGQISGPQYNTFGGPK